MAQPYSIRRMKVRSEVLHVLSDTHPYWLLESTLMSQVNLSLVPAAAPTEIRQALDVLKGKDRVDWQVDEDDSELRRWKITDRGLAQIGE